MPCNGFQPLRFSCSQDVGDGCNGSLLTISMTLGILGGTVVGVFPWAFPRRLLLPKSPRSSERHYNWSGQKCLFCVDYYSHSRI